MKSLLINGGEVSGPALDVDHLVRLGGAFGGRHRQVLLGRWSDDATAKARAMALAAGMMSAGTVVLDGQFFELEEVELFTSIPYFSP